MGKTALIGPDNYCACSWLSGPVSVVHILPWCMEILMLPQKTIHTSPDRPKWDLGGWSLSLHLLLDVCLGLMKLVWGACGLAGAWQQAVTPGKGDLVSFWEDLSSQFQAGFKMFQVSSCCFSSFSSRKPVEFLRFLWRVYGWIMLEQCLATPIGVRTRVRTERCKTPKSWEGFHSCQRAAPRILQSPVWSESRWKLLLIGISFDVAGIWSHSFHSSWFKAQNQQVRAAAINSVA